jgi:hypothetical protein
VIDFESPNQLLVALKLLSNQLELGLLLNFLLLRAAYIDGLVSMLSAENFLVHRREAAFKQSLLGQ